MKLMSKCFVLLIITIISISFAQAMTSKEIYKKYCINCHSPEMASMFNAPIAHDKKSWQERKKISLLKAIKKNKAIKKLTFEEKQKEILIEFFEVAIEGTMKGMPPKGTCMECTDDELRSAINYITNVK